MIRLYKKDNTGHKDFQNNLFSTNLCSFDFPNNTITINGVDYYADKINDLNECSCSITENNTVNNNIRSGKVSLIKGETTTIVFSTPFDSPNYTLSFTSYNDDGIIGVEITNRTANGFDVFPIENGYIEYQAIYIN